MYPSGGSLTRIDKALLVAGAVGICICIYLLFFDQGSKGSHDSASALGKVTFKAKDTRQKSGDSFEWDNLKDNQEIFVGDSIYSGEDSQVEVGMKTGGAVQVGANSLVTFDMIEKDKIMDLELGNFRIKVDGQMKIAVNGKLTVIDGKKSEVQVFIGKNKKPQLRLLSGEAKLTRKEQTVELKPNIVANLPAPDIDDQNLLGPGAKPKALPKYVWKLYDLYDIQGRSIKAKDPAPVTYELESQVITPHLLEEFTPVFATPEKTFAADFVSPETPQHFPMIAPPETIGFVFESSLDQNFTPGQTFSGWSKSADVPIKFPKPETYYYRFRAVSPSQELSPWSRVAQFNVLPPKPVLAKKEAPVKEPKKKSAEKKPVIAQKKAEETNREIAAIAPVPPSVTEPQPVLTGPTESSSIRLPGFPSSSIRNEKYKSTQLSLQGFMWTLQSTEQRYANQTAPVASGLGAHGLHWFNNHGFEWNLKSGVLPMNANGSEASSLKYLESRYHYRFFSKASFNFTRELQWSLFGGAEIYRNSGNYTSRQYNLLKYGSSLEFPLAREWSTGGELVLGTGTDGSRQQQISGNINYFVSPDWSLGVGYRLHMFEAGSAASTPNGILPYREGYTEGTSFLNYHF